MIRRDIISKLEEMIHIFLNESTLGQSILSDREKNYIGVTMDNNIESEFGVRYFSIKNTIQIVYDNINIYIKNEMTDDGEKYIVFAFNPENRLINL